MDCPGVSQSQEHPQQTTKATHHEFRPEGCQLESCWFVQWLYADETDLRMLSLFCSIHIGENVQGQGVTSNAVDVSARSVVDALPP